MKMNKDFDDLFDHYSELKNILNNNQNYPPKSYIIGGVDTMQAFDSLPLSNFVHSKKPSDESAFLYGYLTLNNNETSYPVYISTYVEANKLFVYKDSMHQGNLVFSYKENEE